MISNIALSLLAALASAASTSSGQAAEDPEIAAVIARATQANALLMRGDIDGYRRQIQTAPDFILMDPFGGIPTGNPKSDEHWRRIGRFFRDGRDAEFVPLGAYRSDNLIVLVANERAHVSVGALPAQDWALRVTLVFRRDDGEWRLVHRHADPLAKGISLEEAGRVTLGKAAAGGDR
ncbi:MAG TPA: nuclear transport factor 2 family protein [Sphingomonas sp.]|nr:nuclear transport factor 2 family protein [Sphingomonas sp.]